jgi:hypothetical protein
MALPQAPGVPQQLGIAAEPLARRIDQFLASRGYTPPPRPESKGAALPIESAVPAPTAGPRPTTGPSPHEKVADFVCEDDVRQAVRQGRKIVIGDHTIVTPAARDLGDQHRVLIQAGMKT